MTTTTTFGLVANHHVVPLSTQNDQSTHQSESLVLGDSLIQESSADGLIVPPNLLFGPSSSYQHQPIDETLIQFFHSNHSTQPNNYPILPIHIHVETVYETRDGEWSELAKHAEIRLEVLDGRQGVGYVIDKPSQNSTQTSNEDYSKNSFLDCSFKFHFNHHLEYSIQQEPKEDNDYEAFVSFYTEDNKSMGLVLVQSEEQRASEWLKKASQLIAPSSENDQSNISRLNIYRQQLFQSFIYSMTIFRGKKEQNSLIIKSITLNTTSSYFFLFKPLLRHALTLLTNQDGSSNTSLHDDSSNNILNSLYETISNIPLNTIPDWDPLTKRVRRWALADYEGIFQKYKFDFCDKTFKIKFPLALFPEEIGDEQLSLVKFISKFRENCMTVYNAIFQEKNVVFVGENQSISSICYMVLTACLLVSPPFELVLHHRVFPFCTDESYSSVSGYIAGVKTLNQDDSSWDVICDIDTGKVTTNPKTFSAKGEHSAMDEGFASTMLSVIDSSALKGVRIEALETSIRTYFQDYTRRLACVGLGTAIFEDEQKRRDTCGKNASRLKIWRMSRSYVVHRDAEAERLEQRHIKTPIDCEQLVTKLRLFDSLQTEDLISTLSCFLQHISTRNQILEFLTYFPDSQGGLYPLAVLLFHPDKSVVKLVVNLMNQLGLIDEGSTMIGYLNSFLMFTYDRLKHQYKETKTVE